MKLPAFHVVELRRLADQIERGEVTQYCCYANTPMGVLCAGHDMNNVGFTVKLDFTPATWRERVTLAWTAIRGRSFRPPMLTLTAGGS